MSLQPHFYLGPIEVITDENSALAAVWHSQALQRTLQYFGNHVTLDPASDLPNGLQPELQTPTLENLFLPALHIERESEYSRMSLDSMFAKFQGDSLYQVARPMPQHARLVSVAECLNLPWLSI